jgi:hypothetical protein
MKNILHMVCEQGRLKHGCDYLKKKTNSTLLITFLSFLLSLKFWSYIAFSSSNNNNFIIDLLQNLM